MKAVPLHVQAIGWTHFEPPLEPWFTDAYGGQALVEFAGRACYQSWSKPNPATATNAGYLAHILDVGHLSVLEHGTVTMYLTGVSRTFTHELVRHRHFSYSQLSQRYVSDGGLVVEPDVIAADPYMHQVFVDAVEHSQEAYAKLVRALEGAPPVDVPGHRKHKLPAGSDPLEVCADCMQPWPCDQVKAARVWTSRTAGIKAARQAARSVLPNATETRIVVTGNYRAWRHFVDLRATEHADVEIRAGAVACLVELQRVAPNVFADYVIGKLADGTEVASSPYAEQS